MSSPSLRSHLPSAPRGGWRWFFPTATRKVFWTLVERFSKNNILTYASAVAFQTLIAAVALLLLGLALLDVLGLRRSVWVTHVQPFFESRLTFQTYLAIETTVERIFQNGSLALLLFAALLALWEISGAVRAVSGALNEVYGCEEQRSVLRRFGTSFWLAACLIVCVVGAVLSATLGGRLSLLPGFLGTAAGWTLAVLLLAAAVWLLLRYAPSKSRSVRWTSVGSILIIVAWIVASILFRYYVENVANYKTATGNLAAFLTLTAYLYTSSIIFLTGAQINEMLRLQAERGHTGLEALTTLPGRGSSSSDSDRPSQRSSRGRATAGSRAR